MKQKNILCYGDSNTWGYDPVNACRYGRDVRWPGVLQKELGDGYYRNLRKGFAAGQQFGMIRSRGIRTASNSSYQYCIAIVRLT